MSLVLGYSIELDGRVIHKIECCLCSECATCVIICKFNNGKNRYMICFHIGLEMSSICELIVANPGPLWCHRSVHPEGLIQPCHVIGHTLSVRVSTHAAVNVVF